MIGVAGAVLTLVAWQDLRPGDAYGNLGGTVASLVYATLGVLIVRRVGNRIGWMLVGVGLGLAILSLTDAYAVVGAVTHPGVLPAAKPVGTLAEWIFVPIVTGLAYVLLVFPTGALPSPRWRPISTAAIAITALALVGFIVTPRQVALPAPGGVSLTFPNPFAIRSLGHGISTVLVGTLPSLTLFSVLLYVAAVVALVVRYRSGGPFLRQQIKWVAFAAVAAAACQAALVLAQVAAGYESPVTIIVGLAAALAALFGIPIAITIAILKHGLYEIDVIIKRTVVYGLLAAAATAVYVVVVVGIGSLVGYGVGSPVLSAAAAVAITLLFQPLRRQAQRVANRLVYGERASPYQVLSDLPRTWPAPSRSTTCWTGWCRSSLTAPAPPEPTSGSASGRSCGRSPRGRATRPGQRPSRWITAASSRPWTGPRVPSLSARGTRCSVRSPSRSRGTSRCP